MIPKTLKEYMAEEARRCERRAKRAAKSAWLWKDRPGASSEAARPRKAPSAYKVLLAQADTAWSWLVRRRDAKNWGGLCRVCLKRPIVVAAHVIPRGHLATRLDPRNGVGSCVECNRAEQMNRSRFQGEGGKYAGIIGEDLYRELQALGRKTVKWSADDLRGIIANLKNIIQTGAY